MRIPLLAANWKMNLTVEDSLKFIMRLQKDFLTSFNIEIVICPPFTSLYSLSVALSETDKIKLGAQNCHHETKGAFTGEISPVFLKELDCHYVILGHSERRTLFNETNTFLAKKLTAVFEQGMTPIYCVGESSDERKSQNTFKVIETQLSESLEPLSQGQLESLVIAYEPLWAIGTGVNASATQAQEVAQFIRQWIEKKSNPSIASRTRILYGGSVKPENIASFVKMSDIDGALVGGASLEADSFIKLIHSSMT